MNNRYRESGSQVDVYKNADKDVTIKTTGELYHKFLGLGKTEQNVMFGILSLMDNDMNTIQVGGDTLTELVNVTGYGTQVIRNQLTKLYPLLEKGNLRGEYVVNPVFATKGNEDKIWNMYRRINDGV